MPIRKANAVWEGDLLNGKGVMKSGSGAIDGPYSFGSRFKEDSGTNPEELIGAAHAGCFSMALANILATAGHKPDKIETSAEVTIEKVKDNFTITTIKLRTKGAVPGMDEKTFKDFAEKAKVNCPVSVALKGVKILLEASLAK